MEVALFEIPVHILEGLHKQKRISKESYEVKEVYEFGLKDQPEYVKIITELKILEGEIREKYTKKNTLLKKLENFGK